MTDRWNPITGTRRPRAVSNARAAARFAAVFMLTLFALPAAKAQGDATAARTVQLSAFGLLGDTYTGLGGATNGFGGRNFTLTLGANLGFYNPAHYGVAVEVRGAYPLSSGHVDGQLSILGGVRLERRLQSARWHGLVPYLDLLGGRGEIRYVDGGYSTPGLTYTESSANIGSFGGGLEFPLSRRFAFKADAQFQYWPTPVTADKHITTKQGSGGIVYRFGVGGHAR